MNYGFLDLTMEHKDELKVRAQESKKTIDYYLYEKDNNGISKVIDKRTIYKNN